MTMGMEFQRFLYSEIPRPLRDSMATNLVAAFESTEYLKSFPLVFGDSAPAEHFVFFEKNTVIANLAVLRLTVHSHNTLKHWACIGSVCVASTRRGVGLGHQLLQRVLTAFRAESLDGVCLFAHDPRLYDSLGFCAGEPEALFRMTSLQPSSHSHSHSHSCVDIAFDFQSGATLTDSERRALWHLMCHTQNGIVVSWRDFELFLKETPLEVLSAWMPKASRSREGQGQGADREPHSPPLGFVFFGKGADFVNTWHGLTVDPRIALTEQIRIASSLLNRALELEPGSQLHLESTTHPLFPWLSASFEHALMSNFMTLTFHPSEETPPEIPQLVVPSFLSI